MSLLARVRREKLRSVRSVERADRTHAAWHLLEGPTDMPCPLGSKCPLLVPAKRFTGIAVR